MKSKQLKEERASVNEKLTALAAIENRTDAQNDEVSALYEKRDSLTKAIEAQLMIEADEKRAAEEAAKVAAKAAGADASKSEEKELRNFSISKLIVEAEKRNITGLEKEVIEDCEKEGRANGFAGKGIYLSNKVLNAITPEKRTTMVTSSSTVGGNWVQTDKRGFFEALFAATVLDMLGVQKLTGLSSNLDITGFTASVTAGWAAGETGSQTPSNPTTAARSLSPELLYTACDISRRLLIQTNPSIDQFVMNNMIRQMAVTYEAAVINGTGTNQPLGILGSAIGSVAMGTNGGAPSYSKILELIQTVLTADGSSAARKFLTNPKVVAKLKQTELDSGSGAFIMGYNGLFGSQMGVIDGYEVAVTSNVPSNLDKGTTTGVCSALIFGDFSQVVCAEFGGMELIVDPYTNARTGTISYTINQFLDSTVLQPLALGAIADLTTT